ncbi:MAG: hypothetical protein LC676_10980 [Loktanella sp.]|nr:hypothetical protein [Loktanella sp.]
MTENTELMPVPPGPDRTIMTLVDEARASLEVARTSGEVLEARDKARVAYDAAKSAIRIAKARKASLTVVHQAHEFQGQALHLRCRAEMRFAEEYNAAQDRGEVATGNRTLDFSVGDGDAKPATAADLGVRRDEMHEARQLSEAEAEAPGFVEETVNSMVAAGEEPTRAKVMKAVKSRKAPNKPKRDERALWIWGRLQDFDRQKMYDVAPADLIADMDGFMQEKCRALLPKVIAYLKQMEKDLGSETEN